MGYRVNTTGPTLRSGAEQQCSVAKIAPKIVLPASVNGRKAIQYNVRA